MLQPVFKIKNLQCAYKTNPPVLRLDALEIPRAKLIFIIGKSGIGKSTFIETLGLMNKTILAEEKTSILFFPKANDESIELKNSWSLLNAERANFRKNHFSFIFQNTNLMPNFSAGENMMISLLVKGVSKAQAAKEVKKVMAKLSLESSVFDKKITELSGGQRQRLAFVRAITRDFTVLYGDEPTGNLDETTANELMQTLKDLIQAQQKTGIIVSHNLPLACKFADLIIPISMQETKNGQMKGSIKSENILHNNSGVLQKSNGEVISKPEVYLNQFLKSNT